MNQIKYGKLILGVAGVLALIAAVAIPLFNRPGRYTEIQWDGGIGTAFNALKKACNVYQTRHGKPPTDLVDLEGIHVDPEPKTDDFANHDQVFTAEWLNEAARGKKVEILWENLSREQPAGRYWAFAYVEEPRRPGKWRLLTTGPMMSLTREELDEALKNGAPWPNGYGWRR